MFGWVVCSAACVVLFIGMGEMHYLVICARFVYPDSHAFSTHLHKDMLPHKCAHCPGGLVRTNVSCVFRVVMGLQSALRDVLGNRHARIMLRARRRRALWAVGFLRMFVVRHGCRKAATISGDGGPLDSDAVASSQVWGGVLRVTNGCIVCDAYALLGHNPMCGSSSFGHIGFVACHITIERMWMGGVVGDGGWHRFLVEWQWQVGLQIVLPSY